MYYPCATTKSPSCQSTCNGHSSSCNECAGTCQVNICLYWKFIFAQGSWILINFFFLKNCQYNTYGDRCQYCKSGYVGDATRGTKFDCMPAMPYYNQNVMPQYIQNAMPNYGQNAMPYYSQNVMPYVYPSNQHNHDHQDEDEDEYEFYWLLYLNGIWFIFSNNYRDILFRF